MVWIQLCPKSPLQLCWMDRFHNRLNSNFRSLLPYRFSSFGTCRILGKTHLCNWLRSGRTSRTSHWSTDKWFSFSGNFCPGIHLEHILHLRKMILFDFILSNKLNDKKMFGSLNSYSNLAWFWQIFFYLGIFLTYLVNVSVKRHRLNCDSFAILWCVNLPILQIWLNS